MISADPTDVRCSAAPEAALDEPGQLRLVPATVITRADSLRGWEEWPETAQDERLAQIAATCHAVGTVGTEP